MTERNDIELLITGHGFTDFRWIDPKKIVTAHGVRVKCAFGCADYGLGACPPNTPSVADCRAFFDEYASAILIRLTVQADKNTYPVAWSKDATRQLLDLERTVFLQGHPQAFLLNQTCCAACAECPGTRAGCQDKKISRPSPEAFAVDVYRTADLAGLGIHVIAENPSMINRIAILLIE